ncbi:unnamed protein product [Cylindrotheca closterium]|uniref:Aspartyl/asparaginy/proline hydroxylase domain-containing protein n=1 Tax=Cylindrotheca closterium TaxID=2856 RepID=A0AAD2CBJ1_9STRA|nr:unnamed protein product [Cylindrotheca closterium]
MSVAVWENELRLLSDLVDHPSEGTNDWWELVDETASSADPLWQQGQDRWYQQDYLVAMQAFQQSLVPLDLAWDEHQNQFLDNSESSADSFNDYHDASEARDRAVQLAHRLVFCSYCESDGNQVKQARKHLIMGLYLLLSNRNMRTKANSKETTLLNDAWMELMLSFEEDPACRILARDVAEMAIKSSKGRGVGNCGWHHKMQRPGYMVPGLKGTPYISGENQPAWCKTLEDHWEIILDEYDDIVKSKTLSVVGAGDRGSGQDDHRVVGAGSKWTEYVLFGTGSSTGDAPATKALLEQHLPDAVSLAQEGGGEIIFSRLAPGSHIQSHCGPTNIRWTGHLGLIVPESAESCKIRVGDQWHSWQEGKILLFDDSFEHEVRNDSEQERVVLLIRLWHPDLKTNQRSSALEAARTKKDKAVEKRYAPPF